MSAAKTKELTAAELAVASAAASELAAKFARAAGGKKKKPANVRFPPPALTSTVAGNPKSTIRIAYLVRGEKNPAFAAWPFLVARVAPTAGADDLYLVQVTASEIADGILFSTEPEHRFNCVFVPGGLAAVHARALGAAGKQQILKFVGRYGGGYFGICAGAYLSATHRDSLRGGTGYSHSGGGDHKSAANSKQAKSKAAATAASKAGGKKTAANANSHHCGKDKKSGTSTVDDDDEDGDGDDGDDDDDDADDDSKPAPAAGSKPKKSLRKVVVQADGSSTVNTSWAYGIQRLYLRDVEHWNRGVGDVCFVSYTEAGKQLMCADTLKTVAYPTKAGVFNALHDPKLKIKAAANSSGGKDKKSKGKSDADTKSASASDAFDPDEPELDLNDAPCGDDAVLMTMRYANGPLFDLARDFEYVMKQKAEARGDTKYVAAADDDSDSDDVSTLMPGPAIVLARFESEFTRNLLPKGVMIGTPAIVANTFGSGRVVCISPHPEKSDLMMAPHLKNLFRYAAGKLQLTIDNDTQTIEVKSPAAPSTSTAVKPATAPVAVATPTATAVATAVPVPIGSASGGIASTAGSKK